MSETQVTKQERQDVQKERMPGTETIYIPDVDIRENSDSIRLVADMPGVDQKSAEVTVENNVLTIEGRASVDAPEGYKLVGQEYGVGKFRRDFTLSNAVDTQGIKARVRHGVLEVTIPKRDEVRTKKIEIE
jgi:HSP20 family protein